MRYTNMGYAIAQQTTPFGGPVPCAVGKPGQGKTAFERALGAASGREFVQCILRQMMPEDIKGVPAPEDIAIGGNVYRGCLLPGSLRPPTRLALPDWPPPVGSSGPPRRRAPRAGTSRRGSARGRGRGRRSTCRSRQRRGAGGPVPVRRRARSSRRLPAWRACRARARRGRRAKTVAHQGAAQAGLAVFGVRAEYPVEARRRRRRPAVAQQQHGERDVAVDVVRHEQQASGEHLGGPGGCRHGQEIGGEAGVGRRRQAALAFACAARAICAKSPLATTSARWVNPYRRCAECASTRRW